ncbi:MAG: hypothetical protein AMXMBFR6_03530 [Betaproteobacteria bacterium]
MLANHIVIVSHRTLIMNSELAIDLSHAPTPACLAATAFLDCHHPAVIDYANGAIGNTQGVRDRAIKLYYAVRDGIRYDPYHCNIGPESYRASAVLADGRGYCIPKALLLATLARAVGIPSGIGLADVRNHLATEEMLRGMNTTRFFHGYTLLYLDDHWVKASPAFNLGMCQRFDVLPLEFDGIHDALLHPYDARDRRHMEYLGEHGTFSDLPIDFVLKTLWERYPGYMRSANAEHQFETEAPAQH